MATNAEDRLADAPAGVAADQLAELAEHPAEQVRGREPSLVRRELELPERRVGHLQERQRRDQGQSDRHPDVLRALPEPLPRRRLRDHDDHEERDGDHSRRFHQRAEGEHRGGPQVPPRHHQRRGTDDRQAHQRVVVAAADGVEQHHRVPPDQQHRERRPRRPEPPAQPRRQEHRRDRPRARDHLEHPDQRDRVLDEPGD
jgi:hypothetical protein